MSLHSKSYHDVSPVFGAKEVEKSVSNASAVPPFISVSILRHRYVSVGKVCKYFDDSDYPTD